MNKSYYKYEWVAPFSIPRSLRQNFFGTLVLAYYSNQTALVFQESFLNK